jgi:ABC-2 type transport system ATP-binding protein
MSSEQHATDAVAVGATTNGRARSSGVPVVVIDNISKSYGDIRALDGVTLQIPGGTVLGLLGPNGAGKTTLVRILTTLLNPDGGSATVAGYDVVHERTELRGVVGLAGQFAAVDQALTGRENLEMVGRLYHFSRKISHDRACELLERFDLLDAAERPAKTYSGGMRRRLDLAASLVARPQVLFLDEPTAGLDPRSRLDLWNVVRELVRDGTTVLLTTQYLEEADQLADNIVVIDHGRIIAEGTAADLKARTGGEVLTVRLSDAAKTDAAAAIVARFGTDAPNVDRPAGSVSMPLSDGARALAGIVRDLDEAGLEIAGIEMREPTLNEVFLSLTGQSADADDGATDAGQAG